MGSKLFLIGGALAGAALCGAPALAQSSVDRCRAMPTDAERFACLENALAAAEAALAAGAPATTDAPGDEGGEGFRIDIPFFGGGEDGEAATAGAAGTGLGAEQLSSAVRTPDGDEPRVQAVAVSYGEHAPGQWQFELESGEVWRQLVGDTTRLALFGRQPLRVEIWESWAGGYRMRLMDRDRTVQVQRVR